MKNSFTNIALFACALCLHTVMLSAQDFDGDGVPNDAEEVAGCQAECTANIVAGAGMERDRLYLLKWDPSGDFGNDSNGDGRNYEVGDQQVFEVGDGTVLTATLFGVTYDNVNTTDLPGLAGRPIGNLYQAGGNEGMRVITGGGGGTNILSMRYSLSFNGEPLPFEMLFMDGEVTGSTEYVQALTNGTDWVTVDNQPNSNFSSGPANRVRIDDSNNGNATFSTSTQANQTEIEIVYTLLHEQATGAAFAAGLILKCDANNNGTADFAEPCYPGTGTPDPNNAVYAAGDCDLDGTLNGTDPDDADRCVPNPDLTLCPTGDANNNGVTNGMSCGTAFDDNDADGVFAYLDDNDGDAKIGDADGMVQPFADRDGSGTLDCEEDLADSDADGVPDFVDQDLDNDGIPNLDECTTYTIYTFNNFSASRADALAYEVVGSTTTTGTLDQRTNYLNRPNITFVGRIWGRLATDVKPDANGDIRVTFDANRTIGGVLAYIDAVLFVSSDGTMLIYDREANGAFYSEVGPWERTTTGNPGPLNGEARLIREAAYGGVDPGTYTATYTIPVGSCDADGDGIVNDLDRDSDGDGCPDANEAGIPGIAVGNMTVNMDSTLAGGVNANGIPVVADTDGDGTVDYTISDNYLNASIDACTDTDGDFVVDVLDLDDDNDGIPDLTECITYTIYTYNNFSATRANALDYEVVGSTTTTGTLDERTNYLNRPNITFVGRIWGRLATQVKPDANGNIRVTFDANRTIGGVLAYVDAVLFVSSDGTMLIYDREANGAFYNEVGPWERTTTGNPGPLNGEARLIREAAYGGVDPGTYTATYTIPVGTCDTDGDGIADDLDRDSDGDGCPDANEAGIPGVLVGNMTVNMDSTLAGEVNANGIPVIADTDGDGVIDYTPSENYKDADVDAACADNDMDGIGDISDLDDDNDGIPDSIECPLYSVYFSHNASDRYTNNLQGTVVGASTTDVTVNQRSAQWDRNYLGTDYKLLAENVEPAADGSITVSFDPTGATGLFAIFDAVFIDDGTTVVRIDNNEPGYREFGSSWSGETRVGAVNGNTRFIREADYNGRSVSYTFSNVVDDCDVDGDGITNSLDLDSDGDGCPDANEAGIPGIAVGNMTVNMDSTLAGEVNANGIPVVADTDGDGMVDYTVSDNYLNASIEACTDSDGDSVVDALDLDDDNDGIPDTIECPILAYDVYISYRFSDARAENVSVTVVGATTFNTTYSQTTSPTAGASGVYEGINFEQIATGIVPDADGNITVTQSPTGSTNRFVAYDAVVIDGGDGFTLIDAGQPGYTEVGSGYSTVSNQDGYINRNWRRQFATDYTGSSVSYAFTNVAQPDCDPDGDGITNSLDLDSDGDGCPDANEAGIPGIAVGNMTVNMDSTLAGEVNANGIPVVADTDGDGTVDYTVSGNYLNASIEACTDSDGDSVADAFDLDDDNDGIPDSLECPKPQTYTLYSSYPGFSIGANQVRTIITGQTVTTVFVNQTVTSGGTQFAGTQFYPFASDIIPDAQGNIEIEIRASNAGGSILTFDAMLVDDGTSQIIIDNGQAGYVQNGTGYVMDGRRASFNGSNIRLENNNYTGRTVTYTFNSLEIPPSCDADGDGITNNLDGDSDGDGCADIIESGLVGNGSALEGFTLGDTTFDFTLNAVGDNGLLDVIETAPESGMVSELAAEVAGAPNFRDPNFQSEDCFPCTVDVIPVDSIGCSGEELAALTVNEVGGSYSVVSNSGTSFDEATGIVTLGDNAGTSDIMDSLIYTLPTGCADTLVLTINANPVVTITDPGDFCADAGAVLLEGTPAGGTFSGLGVTGNMFDPAVAGTGGDEVFYEYTDPVSGCVGLDTLAITVFPLPAPVLTPAGPFCERDASIQLEASISGGTYSTISGTGVSADGLFDPAFGTQEVIYTVTDANMCTGADTITIEVNENPTAMLAPVDPLCADSDPIFLSGTPSSLVSRYEGPGLFPPGNLFIPSATGAGEFEITYIFVQPNTGCADTTTTVITVNPVPEIVITPVDPICANAESVSLEATPAGGTFSGMGVDGMTFDPAVAGTGDVTITYDYTDPTTMCMATATLDIQVLAIPVVAITDPGLVCSDAEPITLEGAPTGGVFSGTGVADGLFDPANGSTDIVYTVTAANGCVVSDTLEVIVTPAPVVEFTPVDPLCVDADPVALAATPAGGEFNGAGVSMGMFDPAVAGVGIDEVTYTVTVDGCTTTDTLEIIVNDLPVITFAAAGPFCSTDAAVTLTATPAMGTFSGTGISGDQFDPALANIGANEVTYTVTDANGCENSETISINVNATPEPQISPVADVCLDAPSFFLSASPAGGIFSGTGVDEGLFDPAVAGVGDFEIIYGLPSADGCFGADTITITVKPVPEPVITMVDPLCVDADPITLIASIAGGTFEGDGAEADGSFNPAVAGAGTTTITYTVEVDGCSATTTLDIVVNPLAEITFPEVAALCVDAAPITLSATPAGGTFSGTGVDATGLTFDPALAAIGDNIITYEFTDANGCVNSAEIDIIVNPLPVVTVDALGPLCVDGNVEELTASPTGGVFTGPGVVDDTLFNPALANVGANEVIYTFTNPTTGCIGSDTIEIMVDELPVVSIEALPAIICMEDAAITLVGTPAGGTFNGTGVSGNTFNPGVAMAGPASITYTFTAGDGCQNSTTVDFMVTANPELSLTSAVCAPTILTYDVTLDVTDGTAITSTAGTVMGNTVIDIPTGMDVVITGTLNGCTTELNVTAPVCECPILEAPMSGGDGEVCFGEDAPILTATTAMSTGGQDLTINWYDAATGGTLVAEDTTMFMPLDTDPGSYEYFVETVDLTSGCTSLARTEIDFIIDALPTVSIDAVPDECPENAPVTLSATPRGW